MKPAELALIRHGAELQSLKPYMDNEIEGLKKAVVSAILAAVNNGTLTPEMALSKWVEYVSYIKLQQKIDQRIAVGVSVGSQQKIDFDPKIGYTSTPTT